MKCNVSVVLASDGTVTGQLPTKLKVQGPNFGLGCHSIRGLKAYRRFLTSQTVAQIGTYVLDPVEDVVKMSSMRNVYPVQCNI